MCECVIENQMAINKLRTIFFTDHLTHWRRHRALDSIPINLHAFYNHKNMLFPHRKLFVNLSYHPVNIFRALRR